MKVLLSAIEPSANKYLRDIVLHLKVHDVEIEFLGIADGEFLPNSLYDVSDLGVMGIWNVLKKWRLLKKAMREMIALGKDADAFIGVDAPSFNLPVAKALKSHHPRIKTFYYILPKVWAWKSHRVADVESCVDYPISIFGFEKSYYHRMYYFGNPLYDEYVSQPKTPTSPQTIGFLPGSRSHEIKSLMPLFRQLHESLGQPKALVVIPPHFDTCRIDDLYGSLSGFEVVRSTKEALARCQFAFVCSGTATLETTLAGVPFVLCYKTGLIDGLVYEFFIKRNQSAGLSKINAVGLANIVAHFHGFGRVHEELFPDVTLEGLLRAYRDFDHDTYKCSVEKVRTALASPSSKGSLEQCADFIAQALTSTS